MNRVKAITKSAVYAVNLFTFSGPAFTHKLRAVYRYTPLYYHHYSLRLDSICRNLTIKRQQQDRSSQQSTQYYKQALGKYLELKRGLTGKSKEVQQNLKKEEIRESLFQSCAKFIFEKMGLFYESLQSLVEGRREVINNEDYVFEDGRSVRQKREQFQRYMSRLFGKPIHPAPPTDPSNKRKDRSE